MEEIFTKTRVSSNLFLLHNDYKQSSFVNNIESIDQKYPKWTLNKQAVINKVKCLMWNSKREEAPVNNSVSFCSRKEKKTPKTRLSENTIT